jgi:uncharacterized membrane protein YecN with MAPEG domain
MQLTTTLSLAAAAILINLWHFIRIVRIRTSEKIIHGDGGNALLMRRMRAQANFIENAPLTLILIGLIEATGKGGHWLAYVGAVYLLARVAHGFGMDAEGGNATRGIGMMGSLLIQVSLAVVGVLIVLGKF